MAAPTNMAQALAAVETGLARIAHGDGALKAFLTIDSAGARQQAGKLADKPAAPLQLAGTLCAIKDLTDTAGLRTSYGSVLFADHVPEHDDVIVARLRRAGALILGKTMTPEFGFGALCRNELGGPTANPWDLTLTSGGSSGGSAAAVASGMIELGHGTDFGGSVRTPAGFCGIASLRPTPGMLPNPKRALGYDMLATAGFLARDVDMLSRALLATAGPDAFDPLSRIFQPAPRGQSGMALRIAVTDDFGVAPVASDVRGRFAEAITGLPARLGEVRRDHPDCADALAIFHVLRPALIHREFGELAQRFAQRLSETVRWWIRRGEGITAHSYLQAEAARTALTRRFIAFFEHFDVLIAPAASVMPWPNTVPDVTEIDGRQLATIADYLAITFIVSLAGCPVVTLPAPLRRHRLPFGVQLIGPPGSDLALLAIAARFEAEAEFRYVTPPHALFHIVAGKDMSQ